jgi:predicted metal-dependent peptidase
MSGIVSRARARVALVAPPLAVAVYRLREVISPEVGTAAVDTSWRLYVNPDWWQTLDVAEQATVLVHEAMHLLRGHHARLSVFPQVVANLAGDAEINDDLQLPPWRLPQRAVTPGSLNLPQGRTAEWYASQLGNSPPDAAAGSLVLAGSGADGHPRPWELPVDEAAVAETPAIAAQVAAAVRQWGDAPQGMRRWADSVLAPRPAPAALLRRILSNALTREGDARACWTRPGRRSAARVPVLTPRWVTDVPSVVLCVDTSGSMSERQLRRALEVIDGVTRALNASVYVATGDTGMATLRQVRRATEVELVGGGGTDMPALAREAQRATSARVAVIITDGYTPWGERPPFEVIAVVPHNAPSTPHWVRRVELEDWE